MSSEKSFRSSTARLAIVYGAAVLLLVVALQGTVFLLTRSALQREVHTVVSAELESLAEDFNDGGIDSLIDVLRSRADSWGRTGAVYLLTDESLQPLAGNLAAWPADVSPVRGHEVEFRIETRGRDAGETHPVWARIEELPGNYWLLVGTDTSESRRALSRFGLATLWGIGLITALIGVLGWGYSRQTARRVRDFTAACDSIVHSDLGRRLQLGTRSDEFDQLSGTVNNMLNRIEQQATLLRATFGSIAHDLRTPLYRLRVRLEEGLLHSDTSRATRDLVVPALDELDRVQRTLGTLLEIARAEAGGLARKPERIDLVSLAQEMYELYAPGMQEKDLKLQLDLTGEAPIGGERQLLAQLIANLLENALKYVPNGGHVMLAVKVAADRTTLIVADDGRGIAAPDRERAQRPFVRLEETAAPASGSGLGLSLVRAIARVHRGDVELQDNHPGLRVVCSFPSWRE
ncbi:MAG TPA: HAMP domain-containing sensor histidine kinase [Steroidobacteraceae bacterium]|nr:HAMP domain-containing sensor histidine kinase [Steroidobacteraceae bacterium]